MKNKLTDTPYPGLYSFQEKDQAYFFGRKQETQEIIASLLTARLTFLFGSSGVGKTSLLNAGVIASLRKKIPTPLTQNISFKRIIVSFNDWREQNQGTQTNGFSSLKQIIKAELIAVLTQKPDVRALNETEKLKESLRSVLGDVLEEQSPQDLDTHADLSSVLTTATKLLDGNIIILLDQFEEYLSQSGTETEIQERDKELIEAINHADPRIRFLIAIREENLHLLDRFRKKIPQFFTRSYRLNPLSPDQVRDAIEKPLQTYHRLSSSKDPVRVDIELVEQIMADLPLANPSQACKLKDFQYQEITQATVGFEASYLQLLLSQLWETAVKQEISDLNLSSYNNLSDITSLLKKHIKSAIDRQGELKEIAKKCSICLVTSEGEQSTVSLSALSKSCKSTPEIISKILRAFIDRERILRPLADGRFILFHDLLAPILLEDRKAYEKDLEDIAVKQKLINSKNQTKKAIQTAQRFRRISASLAAILLLSIGVTLFAFNQEKQAEERIQIATTKVEQADKAQKQAELKREKAETQTKQAEVTRQKAEIKRKETEKRLSLAAAKAKQAQIAQQKTEAKRKQTEKKRALAASKAKQVALATPK
ncbi:AAA family ATPase, partial [Nitrospira defluvii]|nr:AAA family ATPase [Nitrospira defluvii]